MSVTSTILSIPQQCVVFVENVLGQHFNVGDAYQLATVLPESGWTQVKATAAQAGDLIVFQPGAAGVGSAGHVGLVGTNSGSEITFSQANSEGLGGAGSPPTLGHISVPSASSSGIAVFAPPSGVADTYASLAQQAQTGLAGGASDTLSAAANGTLTTVGTGSQSLSESVSNAVTNGGFGSSITGPVTGLLDWAGQSSLKYSLMFDALSVVLIGTGLYLLLRQEKEGISPINVVTAPLDAGKAAAKVVS